MTDITSIPSHQCSEHMCEVQLHADENGDDLSSSKSIYKADEMACFADYGLPGINYIENAMNNELLHGKPTRHRSLDKTHSDNLRFESAFILREDTVLLDPETDLVVAEMDTHALRSEDYHRRESGAGPCDVCVDNAECTRSSTTRDEFLKLSEHNQEINSLRDLTASDSVLTDVITETKASNLICSELHDLQEDKQLTSLYPGSDSSQQAEPEDYAKCHINCLPVEVLHKIFSYLSIKELSTSVVSVCKLWMQVAYDPIFWQTLDFGHFGLPTEDAFYKMIDRAQLLRYFTTDRISCLSQRKLLYVVEHCPRLKSLNLGFSNAVDVCVLQKLASNCVELEQLNLEGVHFSDDKAVISQLCRIKMLKSLNLAHSRPFQDSSIISLCQNLHNLTDINIDGLLFITDAAVRTLVSALGTQLERVILDGVELTDQSLEVLSKCPKLHALHISFCEQLSDKSLTFVKTMSNLKDLKLKNGYQFTSSGLELMFDGDALSQLKHLDLTDCMSLEDGGAEKLAKCCGGSLTELELCWCFKLTDRAIEAIIEYCRKLVKLNLLGLRRITGCGLTKITENLPHVVSLDLTQCDSIDDEMVIQIARAMPQLTVLNYYGNEILSNWLS